MSYININNYLYYIWDSILENINGFYYFLWNVVPNEKEVDKQDDSNNPIQMNAIGITNNNSNRKSIKEHIERLEFVLSKEIKKDLNREELINLVKTEIQYINKKMSMSRNISQINVDDIVAKTELFNVLQDIASGEVYVEQMINDFNS